MRISVVLPYYENARTLPACLDRLMKQSRPPDEVVIVDDGSQDPARPHVDAQAWPVPVHLHTSAHRGQSGATNVGILAAQYEIVLLTCSDILADEHLVERHMAAHEQTSDDIAVIGRLPYAPTVKMTPFMRYMDTADVQFSFEKIDNPEDVSPFYCYAPNFSARRQRLLDIGMFDEKFVYGYQDTDLGVRLAESGSRFVYRSEAIGWHDHPTTIRDFVKRQFRVGEATLCFLEKYQKETQLRKMRLLLATYYPLIGSLERHVHKAEQLERTIYSRPVLFEAFKRDLFDQYTLVSGASVASGMASFPLRLRAILGSQFGGSLAEPAL